MVERSIVIFYGGLLLFVSFSIEMFTLFLVLMGDCIFETVVVFA